jgi:lysophospholipase L1-like esterase
MALLLVGTAAAAPMLAAPAQQSAGADRCSAPAEVVALDSPLPQVARRLAVPGGPLTIVALGSSSTAGFGATRPENTYPSRLAALLRARFPSHRIRVVNRGIGGEEAPAMEARIARDVLPEKPDLVIWQAGTNAIVHDSDPLAAGEAVRRGVARIRASGSDVILMDLQYAPAILLHGHYREMLTVLAATAHAEGVALFHRFAMMRHWAEDGRMALPVMLAPDRLHMTDASYDCLARQLGASIVRAASYQS